MFLNNTGNVGGAVLISNTSPAFLNCYFKNNNSNQGGAVLSTNGNATFTNCIFQGNTALAGGACTLSSSFRQTNTTFTNCTFTDNMAGQGSVLYYSTNPNQYTPNVILVNSIIFGTQGNNAIYNNTNGATTTISYSSLEVGIASYTYTDGGNNIITSSSPYVSATDLHLFAGSQAIDAGNNVAVSTANDLDNKPRIVGSSVDMGAYEFQSQATSTTATASPNPSCFGSNVTITATVGANGTPVTTGTVTFTEGTTVLSADVAVNASGQAIFTTSALSAGSHTIVATYNPGSGFLNSTGSVMQDVTAQPTWYLDSDGDGYYVSSVASCTNPGAGYNTTGGTFGDCNDADASVHAPQQYYVDADGDGYGSTTTAMLCSSTAPAGYSTNNTDCNDADASVHTPQQYYVDADQDGYGSTTTAMVCSSTAPMGYSTNNTDCNDNDASVHAPQQYYVDADKDGFGSTTTAMLCSSTAPVGYSTSNTDCDDGNAAINPATRWYKDADNDGYGVGTYVTQCTRPTGYKLASELTAISGDCNDNDATVHNLQTYYRDADGDGYGSSVTTSVCASIPPTGYTTRTGDCNDNNPAINPGAVEVCGNNIDDNCNGRIDETPCYTCQNATGLTTTNITATSATFNWNAIANPVQWQVQYKTTSTGAKWVDKTLTGDKRSVTITGLTANQNYNWHIRAKCGNNWTAYSTAISFRTLAAGAGSVITPSSLKQPISSEEMPGELTVQNYPNPFSRVTTIRYQLPTAAQVSVIVYNQNGQKVAVLANGKQTAGIHQVIFNAGKLSAGLYNYQLQTIDANGKLQSFSGKMIMMK